MSPGDLLQRPAALKWAARLLLYPGALAVVALAMRWAERGHGLAGVQEWGTFVGALVLLIAGSWLGRRYYLATGRRLWF